MIKKIIVSLISTVCTLCIIEICLRIFHPQIMEHDRMFVYDQKLGWKFVSNKKGAIVYPGEVNHYIKTNSMGFRDSSFSCENESQKRILVLGDSFVSNISVNDDEVFTEIVQKGLTNTEVLNFGVNGYGQVQELFLLKEWFPKIQPDAIILVIYIRNDFTDNFKGTIGPASWLSYKRPRISWDEHKNKFRLDSIQPSGENAIAQQSGKTYFRSHLYHLVKSRIAGIKARFPSNDTTKISSFTPPELYLCNSQLSENTQLMFGAMEHILLEIAAFAKNNDTRITFALAPSILQVQDDLWRSTVPANDSRYIKSFPNEYLMSFARENNLKMIDLLPELQKASKEGRTMYNRSEQHWTAEGNQVVAEILLNYIKEKTSLH